MKVMTGPEQEKKVLRGGVKEWYGKTGCFEKDETKPIVVGERLSRVKQEGKKKRNAWGEVNWLASYSLRGGRADGGVDLEWGKKKGVGVRGSGEEENRDNSLNSGKQIAAGMKILYQTDRASSVFVKG